jgi:hypothetical protein
VDRGARQTGEEREEREVKRRAFLAGLATAPLWIRRAFADVSVTAAATAAISTRPTLVWVVPSNDKDRESRAAAFGRLLTNGSDRDLAPLALVDVVCAPAPGDPLMLYVVGRSVRTLDGSPNDIAKIIRSIAPRSDRPPKELAAIARARYFKKAPPGARWGHTTGCGADYEEGPADTVDCGMGSLGELARRFFAFYVKP